MVDSERQFVAVGGEPTAVPRTGGVGHEHVEAVVAATELVGERADGRHRGEIGAEELCTAARPLDGGDGFFPALARAPGQDDVRPASAESTGDFAPDAARRAGDERDLSGQIPGIVHAERSSGSAITAREPTDRSSTVA